MITEVRTPRIFQSHRSRRQSQGTVEEQSTPRESVALSGRTRAFEPLKSLSGRTLLAQASSSALQAADAAGLPAAVTRLFAPAEFLMLNSGDYHDAQHPIGVAQTVGTMARSSGRGEERAQFLEKVGLLHDADERILLDGQGSYNYKEGAAPARVPVTLAFMDLNKNEIQERFEWGDDDFKEAKALVAGSEHPLNDEVGAKQQNHVEGYHRQSPKAILKATLEELPAGRRAGLLEEVQILRYADQMSEYGDGPQASREAVLGLSNEIGVPAEVLMKGNSAFLNSVGKDNQAIKDLPLATIEELSRELEIEPKAFEPEELFGMLCDRHRRSIEETKLGI